jgi:hypothetical protein
VVLEESGNFASGQRSVQWLDINRDNLSGKVIALPKREDVNLPVNEQLIVELQQKLFKLVVLDLSFRSEAEESASNEWPPIGPFFAPCTRTSNRNRTTRHSQNASRCLPEKEIHSCFGEAFRNPSVLPSRPKHSPKNTANSQPSPLSAASAPPSATPSAALLLSSVEGAAVTAVRIEGVLHEFQSISGVVEDATDIILNLKQIPFKLAMAKAPRPSTCAPTQSGVVTSGMIEADGDVEILDKDVYICTVSEGGKIDMEMRLKRGRGYISADKNFDTDLGLGFIPVDSVHSPVRKVNYLVEAARLGQITDYDKLTLEIWTNGTVLPRGRARPFRQAAEGPHEHLHQLRGRG